jgi:hypothetical protein
VQLDLAPPLAKRVIISAEEVRTNEKRWFQAPILVAAPAHMKVLDSGSNSVEHDCKDDPDDGCSQERPSFCSSRQTLRPN